jgi:suppressor of fused
MSEEEELEAPGWDAIDGALERLYGTLEPLHYAPALHARLGGPDPIDGISVYPIGGPRPAWQFVTYGFSELYDKETDDPAVSGYGFELMLRVSRAASDEGTPPAWALNFLQNLGRYVFSSGNVFDAGHYMDLNGPIVAGGDTAIRAIVFAHDPELPEVLDTPNGAVRFLRVVGITLDELHAIKRWNGRAFLEVLASAVPFLATDVRRTSILGDAALREAIETRIAAEGSSTGALFVGRTSWEELRDGEQVVVTLGANGVRDLVMLLPGRIPFGRELTVWAHDAAVAFRPAGAPGRSVVEDGYLAIDMPADAALSLSRTLAPIAGEYSIAALPGIVFRVERSEIKDGDGNVVDVIG